MGNASILNRQIPPPSPPSPVVEGYGAPYAHLVGTKVIWIVYQLMDAGKPMARRGIVKRRLSGTLRIAPHAARDGLHALLSDMQEIGMCELWGARIARINGGTILLHGRQLVTLPSNVFEVPQSWWCVIDLLASDRAGN